MGKKKPQPELPLKEAVKLMNGWHDIAIQRVAELAPGPAVGKSRRIGAHGNETSYIFRWATTVDRADAASAMEELLRSLHRHPAVMSTKVEPLTEPDFLVTMEWNLWQE